MFDLADESNSIILAGVVLLVYEAIVIMCFYFLAPVVMMVLYSIFAGSTTIVSGISSYPQYFYDVTTLMFALSFIIPLLWFVVWVFRVNRGNFGIVIRR